MKRLLVHITVISLILISCKKQEFTIFNLNNGQIGILGHGGSGVSSLYPIDALESVLNCLNKNTEGSELDLQITSDNVLVMFHDDILNNSTTGTGKIRDHTWAEIQEFHYSSTAYSVYKISSLENLLNAVDNPQENLFSFDIKLNKSDSETSGQYIDDFTTTLDSIINSYNIASTVFIEAQSADFLDSFQALNFNVRLFYYPQEFQTGYDIATGSNYYGLSMSNDIITKEDVGEAHSAGLRVIIWRTHSNKENTEAIEKNPDYIETDNLNNLIKLLK